MRSVLGSVTVNVVHNGYNPLPMLDRLVPMSPSTEKQCPDPVSKASSPAPQPHESTQVEIRSIFMERNPSPEGVSPTAALNSPILGWRFPRLPGTVATYDSVTVFPFPTTVAPTGSGHTVARWDECTLH